MGKICCIQNLYLIFKEKCPIVSIAISAAYAGNYIHTRWKSPPDYVVRIQQFTQAGKGSLDESARAVKETEVISRSVKTISIKITNCCDGVLREWFDLLNGQRFRQL